MAFEDLALPRLRAAQTPESPRLPKIGLAAFSDDIEIRKGERIGIRVAISNAPSGYRLDFFDSDPADNTSARFGLTAEQVGIAAVLAFARALDCPPDDSLLQQLCIECSPSSWIGAGGAENPGTAAMAMSRVFDTVLGALAQAWPTRVGAGSCSLGAVVQLHREDERFVDAIPGGEGATPQRKGKASWTGPILQAGASAAWPSWLESTERSRPGSGGGGARKGGDGVVREFHVSAAATATVGIDRRGNPPHGIDRAGPPLPAVLSVVEPGEEARTCESWIPIELAAGSVLRIQTAGGAGHGFGGYGDIEFDASDWFGSKSSD